MKLLEIACRMFYYINRCDDSLMKWDPQVIQKGGIGSGERLVANH